MDSTDIMNSDQANAATAGAQPGQSRDKDILNAVSSRLSAIKHRIECTESRLDAFPAQVCLVQSPGQAPTSARGDP